MAQTPRGGLHGSPSKGHHGVCAVYSETTVNMIVFCSTGVATFVLQRSPTSVSRLGLLLPSFRFGASPP